MFARMEHLVRITALGYFFVGSIACWAGSQLDATYFYDSQELGAPEHLLVEGVKPAALPNEKREFCLRTQEAVIQPFKAGADHFEKQVVIPAMILREELEKARRTYGEPAKMPPSQLLIYSSWVERYTDLLLRTLNNDVTLLGTDARKQSLAFDNPAGTFQTGLCWFHSRLQRSAMYLAHFRPELPKPGKLVAKQLIRELIWMDRVVVVPGFADLHEFSEHYRAEFISALNKWSVVTVPAMASRLGDRARENDPNEVRYRIESLYRLWNERREVLFLRYSTGDFPLGLFSHSKLILQAEPLYETGQVAPRVTGYRFLELDPNASVRPYWVYQYFTASSEPVAIGYVAYDGDLVSISKALREYCR